MRSTSGRWLIVLIAVLISLIIGNSTEDNDQDDETTTITTALDSDSNDAKLTNSPSTDSTLEAGKPDQTQRNLTDLSNLLDEIDQDLTSEDKMLMSMSSIKELPKEIINALYSIISWVPEVRLLTDMMLMTRGFLSFTKDYRKSYLRVDEKKNRYKLFKKNIIGLIKHNANKSNPFQLGINQFTDMSFDEVIASRTGFKELIDPDDKEVFEYDLSGVAQWYNETESFNPDDEEEDDSDDEFQRGKSGNPVDLDPNYDAGKKYTDTSKMGEISEAEVNETAKILMHDGDIFLGASTRMVRSSVKPEVPRYVKVPKTWDWRQYGLMTPIRNQGGCGSCWTFAAVACLESFNHKRQIVKGIFDRNKQIYLSEQHLLDCAGFGSLGCDGGMPQQGWKYVTANRGIAKRKQYPYVFKKETCKYRKDMKDKRAIVIGAKKLPKYREDYLEQAIYNYGPVAVAVQMTKKMMYFKNGIFYDPSCNNQVNHAVVAVGFGVENGHKFWIIRNSWDTSWGEKGYFRLSRREQNHCGILKQMYYPAVPGIKDTVDMLPTLNKYKISPPKKKASSQSKTASKGGGKKSSSKKGANNKYSNSKILDKKKSFNRKRTEWTTFLSGSKDDKKKGKKKKGKSKNKQLGKNKPLRSAPAKWTGDHDNDNEDEVTIQAIKPHQQTPVNLTIQVVNDTINILNSSEPLPRATIALIKTETRKLAAKKPVNVRLIRTKNINLPFKLGNKTNELGLVLTEIDDDDDEVPDARSAVGTGKLNKKFRVNRGKDDEYDEYYEDGEEEDSPSGDKIVYGSAASLKSKKGGKSKGRKPSKGKGSGKGKSKGKKDKKGKQRKDKGKGRVDQRADESDEEEKVPDRKKSRRGHGRDSKGRGKGKGKGKKPTKGKKKGMEDPDEDQHKEEVNNPNGEQQDDESPEKVYQKHNWNLHALLSGDLDKALSKKERDKLRSNIEYEIRMLNEPDEPPSTTPKSSWWSKLPSKPWNSQSKSSKFSKKSSPSKSKKKDVKLSESGFEDSEWVKLAQVGR